MTNDRNSPDLPKRFNALLERAIGEGSDAPEARKQAQSLLGVDETNWEYFLTLYRSKNSPTGSRPLRLYEPEKSQDDRSTVAYPTATAPADILQHLRAVEYASLKDDADSLRKAAQETVLWVKKMQAGTGSSLTRNSHLIQQRKLSPAIKPKLGSKGTDLYIEVPHPKKPQERVTVSLAEAQILRSILESQDRKYAGVVVHDIVSHETEEAIHALWSKPCLLDPSVTYLEYFRKTPGLDHSGSTIQTHLPTLDDNGKMSFRRVAPGGHALFFLDSIRAGLKSDRRPEVGHHHLIGAVSNGEDMNSAPDPLMVGWMVRSEVPIALVTTEKTAADSKGGVVGLIRDETGLVHLTVIETAQAKKAGQAELFDSLQGMASTNLTIFNYKVLAPKLQRLLDEVGEDEVMRIIAPDLILNTKEQTDSDGVTRSYVQLEGATGASLMNLDRYWRQHYGEPLVHIINVDRNHRSQFFTPIKFAFDYFLYFRSDRYRVNPCTLELEDLRPGETLVKELKDPLTQDKYYQDIQNVLEAFEGASVLNLGALLIDGQVTLKKVKLNGSVSILNQSAQRADLGPAITAWQKSFVKTHGRESQSMQVVVSADGNVSITGE